MRPALVVVLVVAVLLSGCAQPVPLLHPGDDSSRLEAEIAQRGSGDVPLEPAPPDSRRVDQVFKGLEITGTVLGVCCLLPVLLVAMAFGHGSFQVPPSQPNWTMPWRSN